VNPWDVTRDAWCAVGVAASVAVLEFEILCSDVDVHRARIESRAVPPGWDEVMTRDYRPWRRDPIRIDTAGATIEASVAAMRVALERAAI